MPIPAFRDDGFLPVGIHPATLDEIRNRFGESSQQRRELMQHVVDWVAMLQAVQALRLVLDGSFVTEKVSPNDVDAVMLLPSDFQRRIDRSDPVAWEIEHCVRYKDPQELFVAHSNARWALYLEYFSHTREPDGRTKGLVEVIL